MRDNKRPGRRQIEEWLLESHAVDTQSFAPSLRDFLNAGMPEWLALAVNLEMKRRADAAVGRDKESEGSVWGAFAQRYARLTDELQAPR